MNSTIFQSTHWQLSPDGTTPIQGEADIHQCIANILNTPQGEDVLRPEFGSRHFDYLDQPQDVAVPNMVRELWQAIEKWEPRIKVKEINVLGSAPHFTFSVIWEVVESVEPQIFKTEVKQ